jgi:phosphoribosylanthranilate isomerase
MRRTRVKICGITRPEDARAAVAAGADALGVVLAPSKRQVSLDHAERVFAGVPPLVARVGVFVDAGAAFVAEAVRRLGLTAVQFHGDETPEQCAAAPVPVIKALRVGKDFDPAAVTRYSRAAALVLLDTGAADARGGTGVAFDWEAVSGRLDDRVPLVVAGGLAPGNVGWAVRLFRPFAVDVSSGVESAPGVKDPELVASFCAAVRAADKEA